MRPVWILALVCFALCSSAHGQDGQGQDYIASTESFSAGVASAQGSSGSSDALNVQSGETIGQSPAQAERDENRADLASEAAADVTPVRDDDQPDAEKERPVRMEHLMSSQGHIEQPEPAAKIPVSKPMTSIETPSHEQMTMELENVLRRQNAQVEADERLNSNPIISHSGPVGNGPSWEPPSSSDDAVSKAQWSPEKAYPVSSWGSQSKAPAARSETPLQSRSSRDEGVRARGVPRPQFKQVYSRRATSESVLTPEDLADASEQVAVPFAQAQAAPVPYAAMSPLAQVYGNSQQGYGGLRVPDGFQDDPHNLLGFE